MKRRPLVMIETTPFRLSRKTIADIDTLSQRLNAAAKPAGFPTTDTSNTNSTPRPLKVSRAAAADVAIATVLAMLDDGRLERVELLRVFAPLVEVDPYEAERRRQEKIARSEDKEVF